MVRRKPIGIGSRLGNNLPSLLDSIVKYEDMAKQAEAIRAAQAEQAYASYNASLYPYKQPDNSFIINPIVLPIQKEETPVKQTKRYNGNRSQFINNIYNAYNKSLLRRGSTPEEANRLATMLTEQSAMETGYGSHVAANHNYGGHRVNGKYINYSSDDAYADAHINLLDRKWQGWRTAKNEEDFGRAIHDGKQKYSEIEGSDYGRRMRGTSSNINNVLNMNKRRLRYGGQAKRPKAFIGAIIGGVLGAGASILGSVMNANTQEKIMEENKRRDDEKYYKDLARNMGNVLNARDAQEAYERQFRMAYSNGGRRRLRHGVTITDGGYAIPMGNNTFLLRGGSHEDINETGQTGIGINVNGKEIEGENGEVVQKKPNEVRIFSDTIGINGNTFADLVRMGYNKDELFKIQQSMNGDYGRRRMRNGGHFTRPVERMKARTGLRQTLRDAYNAVRDSWLGDVWRWANTNQVGSEGTDIVLDNGRVIRVGGLQTGAPNVLPGRAGGFRPTDVRRGIQTTRNISNKVTQALRRSTPNNVARATRAPRTLNANKGELRDMARLNARADSWVNAKPFEQAGYQGTSIGVDPNKFNPYTGQVPFYTLRDAVTSHPWATVGGLGIGFGSMAGVNYLIDNNNSQNDDTNRASLSTTPRTVNTSVNTSQQPRVTRTPAATNTGQSTYVTGAARGNNPAPFDAIQIGATPQKLSSIRVNIPMIDAQYYTPNNSTPASTGSTGTQSPRGARITSTGSNRTLATRGASPARTTQSIPGVQFVAPDINNTTPTAISPFAIMQNNGLNETGRNTIAPINQNIDMNPSSTAYDEVYRTNPWGMITKGADWIQLGADAVGSLVSGLINLNTANNIVMPREPAPIQAVKLPTTYSIGSDLAANERSRGMMLDDARRNTSSSPGLASRRNLINLTASDNASRLYQTRSREENNMLTADARNQQDVAIRTAMNDAYYQARLNEMQNRQAMLRGNAYSTMLSGLSDAVGNFIDQGKQRYSDEQAMRYYMALLPEEGKEYIRRMPRKGGRII